MRTSVCGVFAAMVLCALGAAGATAASADPPPPVHEDKTIALTKVVTEIPAGKITVTLGKGYFCGVTNSATSNGARGFYNIASVQSAFRQEMRAAGLKPDEAGENLFEPQGSTSAADFSLGGVIVDQAAHVCIPNASGAAAVNAKGDETLTIDWQVYSPAQNQVVGHFRTTASYEIKEPTPGGVALISNGVFAANVRQLAAMPGFRAILLGSGAGRPRPRARRRSC
jgi:hypothetical protein